VRVRNRTRDVMLVGKGELATSLFARARGLLGHPALAAGEGMLIKPCNSIHTFFMSFPIDAAFLDKQGKVVQLISAMGPWRISSLLLRADSVLELPTGTLVSSGTIVGDDLVILP
jgi:uncharacterized protein